MEEDFFSIEALVIHDFCDHYIKDSAKGWEIQRRYVIKKSLRR